jgi:hypothetical protein
MGVTDGSCTVNEHNHSVLSVKESVDLLVNTVHIRAEDLSK